MPPNAMVMSWLWNASALAAAIASSTRPRVSSGSDWNHRNNTKSASAIKTIEKPAERASGRASSM